MERLPQISIIVPVYKTEAYLEKCVESIVKQTYSNIEIILVDDGSPDTCPAICDKLADTYENVIVYHKQNGGQGSARNYGVEKAHGDFIVFVDSDDYVSADYVQYMWDLKTQTGADIVSCRYMMVDESGRHLEVESEYAVEVVSGMQAFAQTYIYRTKDGFPPYAKLLPKWVTKKYPFPDGYFEDFATSYLYYASVNTVAFGNGALNYFYLQRQGSTLHSGFSEKQLHIFDICDEIVEWMEINCPALRKYGALLYFRQLIHILQSFTLTDSDYEELYNKYHKYFQQNLSAVLCCKAFSLKEKVHYLLLCLPMRFYKIG